LVVRLLPSSCRYGGHRAPRKGHLLTIQRAVLDDLRLPRLAGDDGTADRIHDGMLRLKAPTSSVTDVFSNVGGSKMPILLILILLLLLGALPTWPYSHDWGYYPSGGLGVVLLILLMVVLMGRRGRI
jgi:hypothetical protein